MTIIEMLNRLATVAPDVCEKRGDYFIIGNYMFFDWGNGDFVAKLDKLGSTAYGGRPALAWLADAIMAECEKRGWDYDILYDASLKPVQASHWAGIEGGHRLSADTQAEALLAAFLAVMEGER